MSRNRQVAKVARSCRPEKEKEKPRIAKGRAHERMSASELSCQIGGAEFVVGVSFVS